MAAKILFLCSGNYYRSRFAEHLFNDLAAKAASPSRAFSRALATNLGGRNPGPISPHAIDALDKLGIEIETPIRYPRSLQESDLVQASHIIALKESEHRSRMDQRFPSWTSRVEFWHIDDVDVASPHEALPKLETQVRDLFARLV